MTDTNEQADEKTGGGGEDGGSLFADAAEQDELDVEVALLAALVGSDVGEQTEHLDLNTLSEADKHVLLALMRKRLGLSDGASSRAAAGKPSEP